MKKIKKEEITSTLNVFDFVFYVPSINQMIFDFLNLKKQLQYKLLNKAFSLLDVKIISIKRNQITNDILLQYPKCEKLSIYSKQNKITDINHMKNLSELTFMSYQNNNQFGDDGIKHLYNLTILNIRGFTKITNINHLTKLVELDASHECNITNDGIKDLFNLKKLILNCNHLISNINHLTNLIELKAFSNYALKNDSIKGLINLQYFYLPNCINISNINYLKNLTELNASGYNCGVNDYGIKDLENLIILKASDNRKITCVNHLQKLEKLDASFSCGIDENGINKLLKLKSLYFYRNEKIINLNNIPYIL